MIKFFWSKKEKELQVTVEAKLEERWSGKEYTADEIVRTISYRLEDQIAKIIVEQLKVEIDKLALEGLAQKLIKDYDFDAPIKAHMHKVVEQYLEGMRNPDIRIGRY